MPPSGHPAIRALADLHHHGPRVRRMPPRRCDAGRAPVRRATTATGRTRSTGMTRASRVQHVRRIQHGTWRKYGPHMADELADHPAEGGGLTGDGTREDTSVRSWPPPRPQGPSLPRCSSLPRSSRRRRPGSPVRSCADWRWAGRCWRCSRRASPTSRSAGPQLPRCSRERAVCCWWRSAPRRTRSSPGCGLPPCWRWWCGCSSAPAAGSAAAAGAGS